MSNLRELYQETIIDHSQHPHNMGELSQKTHQAEGFNRLCGDRFTLFLKVENDKIMDARFTGKGCAISTASTSMMIEQIKGKTLDEAKMLFEHFHALLTQENFIDTEDKLGKLVVFSGVREFPSRVKCATLAWHTLQAALENQQKPVSTEESNR